MTYLRRHLDEQLDRLMSVHPAVLLAGIRGAGKTTTASRSTKSMVRLDDPRQAAAVRGDPEAILAGAETPLLIDEWQRVPEVWDVVRLMVDEDRSPGRFILSGSERTAVNAPIHTGAGRFLQVRLRPMTLSERRGVTPAASLGHLAEQGIEALRGSESPYTPAEQLAAAVISGLPGYRHLAEADHQETLRNYFDLSASRDLAEIDARARSPQRVRRYLRAYGAVIGTTADQSGIQQAAGVSRATADSYHDLLTRLGIIEELPAWSSNRLKQLTRRSKRHFVDPALAAADHYETSDALRFDRQRLGSLFESTVVCHMRATSDALGLGWRFSHLRTAKGLHEVDMIADLPDGSLIAVEARAAATVERSEARHLIWLREQLRDRFRAGLVIHPGRFAYRLDDRIAVAPLGVLV